MRSYGRLCASSISLYLSICVSLSLSPLSLYRQLEVFNARSSLNYSWKRQIRRPFSVRAYGNGDKSDLTAVFLPIESIYSPNLRSPSLPFIPFLLFYYSLCSPYSISDVRLSSSNASFFLSFTFFYILRVLFQIYLHPIFFSTFL